MNILENLHLQDEKPATLMVRSTDKLQIMAIGLKKGQLLKRHVSTTPTTLIMLKGVISYEMEGNTTELSAHDTFEIPPNVPHEVTGVEECAWLLVKDKP